ncbi:MAG: PP2C family protein-serine/threonine phosphatase, partial [Acidobacteria bacterium]|nr:PP2C family protein-serine/threonine phosphatase [Acidobacteriota bacterium]
TERKQLLDEMEAAREVQEMLVPATRARTPGYRIQSAYHPMAEVGGDFFQWFETSDHGVLLVTGDVSGKGLRAAMMVSMIVGLLQQRQSEEPAAILRELNRGLAGRVSGGFVTCCAARFTPQGLARIANAGHIPPYKNGSDLKMESGIPLGMLPDAEWDETQIQLVQSDRLVFMSDGVVEARNAKGELLGFDRARELSYRPASEIARSAKRWGQDDDITVIAITHDRAAEHSA